MTVPTVIQKINESLGDDEQVTYYENILVGMYASVLLFVAVIANIVMGYLYFQIPLFYIIQNALVFFFLGMTFSLVVRINLPVKTVDYILSGLGLVTNVYISINFYQIIGPAVWTVATIQLALAMTRMTKTLLYATELGIVISLIYIIIYSLLNNTFFSLGALYYIIQIILFIILFIIFSVVQTLSINRYRYVEKQFQEIQIKNDEIHALNKRIQASKEKIRRLAYHDQLTGLPNRHYLWQKLDREIILAEKRNEILGLIYLDIDEFKEINDTLGHDYGDEVLILVSQKIGDTIRLGDMVARIGGDEFLILIQDAGKIENMIGIIKKLVRQFKKPLKVKDKEWLITVSIGFAFYPNDGKDVETVVRRADIAMYAAKEEGRNQYRRFSKEMEKNWSSDKEISYETIGKNTLKWFKQGWVLLNSPLFGIFSTYPFHQVRFLLVVKLLVS